MSFSNEVLVHKNDNYVNLAYLFSQYNYYAYP